MAKKTNFSKILNIVAVAGAAGGAYLLYKKYKKKTPAEEMKAATDKIKAEQAATSEAIKNQNATNAAQTVFDNINNPNSFKGKVAIIQRVLGVQIDGAPGPQTNNAYQKRFGLDRGTIGVMNLDYYLKKATVDNVFFQI
jgi:hypothetical protein